MPKINKPVPYGTIVLNTVQNLVNFNSNYIMDFSRILSRINFRKKFFFNDFNSELIQVPSGKFLGILKEFRGPGKLFHATFFFCPVR